MAEVGAFDGRLAAGGRKVARLRLEGPSNARTIRQRAGVKTVMERPFSDTKEMLGGPWLVARAGIRSWVVPPLLVVSYWSLVHQAPPTNNQGPTTG